MTPLVYNIEDQKLANRNVKGLIKDFRPDSVTCEGEVIYKGSFGEIVSMATNPTAKENFQFDPNITKASVAVYEKRGVYYTVIRIF